MISRFGFVIIVTADMAMSGHASSDELAYYAIAVAPQFPLLLIGIGLLMGTVVMTSQAIGSGNPQHCGAIWREALKHALFVGVLILIVSRFGEWFLLLIGQPEDIAVGGGKVLSALGWGLPGIFLYIATAFFLEGISRPLPGMVIMIAANILNIILNWFLIYGQGGLSALGAEGAAMATSITRWCMFIAIGGYVLLYVHRRRYGIGAKADASARLGARMRRIGLPMSIAHGMESSAFATMTLFAGLLGAAEVGGYSIAINLLTLSFMGTLGIATAASIRVGNAVGRHDPASVRWAGWVAVSLTLVYVLIVATLFILTSSWLIGWYTLDKTVIAIAIPTITICALATIPDGLHATLMGALRGAADVWSATALYIFSFWLVMVPIGYWLGITQGFGAPGLMASIGIGATVAAILLSWRFQYLTSRQIRPI